MSMLSEPRRRQKWCLNPRGTLWSNDENKVGQKLLEKMGWSKGKGLGKNEDGDPEHIRVNHKNDNKGMGYKGSDDNWIAHQDDFSALLQELNGEHAASPSDDSSDVKQTESLERRSKSSKKRVHYHKFTRGKDLSNYSSSDLSSILGKRKKEQQKTSDEDLGAEKTEDNDNLKKSSMSVSDYFSQKMKKLNKDVRIESKPLWDKEEEESDVGVAFVSFKSDNKAPEDGAMPSTEGSHLQNTVTENLSDVKWKKTKKKR